MAGALYEVFGTIRYSPLEACPSFLKDKKVILKSEDGFISQIPAEAACLSVRIRDIITESGVDESISLPFNQSILSKVVEYLNYHENKPAGEIQTPLQSDALNECGATSWDAKFINVAKEMVFDLVLAASFLGIQSLFYLAGAKVAVMTKDRPEPKLRKDFGMKDDLPEDEAEETRQEYRDALGKKLRISEEEAEAFAAPSLAASSALLAGMEEAVAKSGAAEEEGWRRSTDAKSWRHANWRVAVLQNWGALAKAPEEVCGDRELMFAAILASNGQAIGYATEELKNDTRLVLEAVKHWSEALEEADEELWGDVDFVMGCIEANDDALSYAPLALREDREFLLEAARRGLGRGLKGAAPELREDSAFVLDMIGLDPQTYQNADKALREQREFALAAVERNGLALKYMSRVFQSDRQIVAKAVRSDSQAVAYSHTSCRRDLGMSTDWDGDSKTVGDLLAEGWGRGDAPDKPFFGHYMSLFVEDGKLTCAYNPSYKVTRNVHKIIQFSASNTMTANMGQTNYISANSYLDKMPFFERPEKDAITLMWGAVGGFGMRIKAFGSQDMLNATPEAQTTMEEAAKILRVTVGYVGMPEWYNTQMYDPVSRDFILRPTAGFGSGGHWMGESAAVPAAKLPEREAAEKEKRGEAAPAPKPEPLRAPEPPSSPLAGWPGLAGGAPAAAEPPAGSGSFAEGARVMLVGMKAKNGTIGTLLKQQGTGRWKIKMDGNGGLASLKEENLMLVGASAAQPPAVSSLPAQAEATPSAAPQRTSREKEQREKFHVLGSWSNWGEPQEMTWDRSSRSYTFRLRLTYRVESFQILHEGSSQSCLHPEEEVNGAPGTDYTIEGPDDRRKCRGLHWTIGNHPEDQGATGAQYDVKLTIRSDGKPKRVCWRRVT